MNQTEKDITEKQKNLMMDREIGLQMEILIPKMQKLANNYKLGDVKEKSPFRNVLNVATEPGSGIEVTKNYIRYQLGRSGANRMWRDTDRENKSFAVTLVTEIEALAKDAEEIAKSICKELNTDSDKDLLHKVHLRLMQLYLGNLARFQTYLTKSGGNN